MNKENPVRLHRVFILYKSSGVAAFAAKFFGGFSVLKTIVNSHCARGGNNLLHRLPEKISKGNITVVVQTAWDNGAIPENTDLIPETIAEYGIPSVFC